MELKENLTYAEVLETISSEDSLLGIILEAKKDSGLTKEEIIESVKQEIEILELYKIGVVNNGWTKTG